MPREYWSVAPVIRRIVICSGLMYSAVPIGPLVAPAWVPPSMALAIPKSITIVRPSWSIMMFDGLMSRCTIPWLWACWRAVATSNRITWVIAIGSFPAALRTRSSDWPSMYSITR